MFEFLASGVFGSIVGGVFRLIPEAIKYFDKKNERAHELSMFQERMSLEKMRGEQKLDEIRELHQESIDTGVLSAFSAAIEGQTQMAVAAGGWAAKLSALVRPLITYWVWFLYSTSLLVLIWTTWTVTKDPEQIAKLVLTPDFITLLCGITNFWFLDRMLHKRGLR